MKSDIVITEAMDFCSPSLEAMGICRCSRCAARRPIDTIGEEVPPLALENK